MERWFTEVPTHHCAISVGQNASLLQKVSQLMNVAQVTL
jgi:L-arabinose isomerase